MNPIRTVLYRIKARTLYPPALRRVFGRLAGFTYERVPEVGELSQSGWDLWCKEKGFDPLADTNQSRRAWSSDHRTYLRHARWLIFFDDELIGFDYE